MKDGGDAMNDGVKITKNFAAARCGSEGLTLSPGLLETSGLSEAETLQVFALNDMAAVLKAEMTAADIVRVIESTSALAQAFLAGLLELCGPCEQCSEHCPYREMLQSADVEEQEFFRIPELSQEMRDLVLRCDLCIGNLCELLGSEDIVYGEQ